MNSSRLRPGLSLPELMISLAISALLLTAVAAAFSASASAIEVNDKFYRATQAARVSVDQICSLVRKSDSFLVTPYDGHSASASGTTLGVFYDQIANNGVSRNAVYQYDSTNQVLQVIPDGTTTPVVLAHNVSAVTFTADMVFDPSNNTMTNMGFTIDLTVQVSEEQVHIRGSTFPRQKVIFR